MKTLAWRQIAVTLVIGFLLGNGFSLWQRQQFMSRMHAVPDQKKERLLQRFERELRLTDDQRARVKNVLGSTVDQTEALRAEMRPKFKAIRAEMKREIQTLLTPEQQKRFEAMEAKWEARKNRWGSRPDQE